MATGGATDDEPVHVLTEEEKEEFLDHVVTGRWREMQTLLKASENANALVAIRNERGLPIHCLAAMLGRSRCLTILLDAGADIDVAYTANGYRLLHLAAMWGHVDCLKVLLDRGCDELATGAACGTPYKEAQHDSTREVLMLRAGKASMNLLLTTVKKYLGDGATPAACGIARDELNKAAGIIKKGLEWLKSHKNKYGPYGDFKEQHEIVLEGISVTVGKLAEGAKQILQFYEVDALRAMHHSERYAQFSAALNTDQP